MAGLELVATTLGTTSLDSEVSTDSLSWIFHQKAQRAFAAQLLSPWEAVRDMLGNDRSQENQDQVAEHFAVSSMTIRTLLDNHPGS